MEAALKGALAQIQAAVDFLIKIEKKLDKKTRKERDDLLEKLKTTLHKSQGFINTGATNNKGDTGEVYDDVANQSGEVYDDVNGGDNNTYNDNTIEIYEDTNQDEYDDVQAKPEPKSASGNKEAPAFPPIPCESLYDATLAEFLEVKRERTLLTGGWSKRWCVLHQNVLYIYEKSKDKKQKEAIDLRGFVFDVREDITREVKRKDRCFELKNEAQKKVYDFCAQDKDAMLQWKSKLLQTNVVTKGSDCSSDTPSMKSDSESNGKSKSSVFSAIKNKLKVSTTPTHDATAPSDDVYTDTVENDTYNDTSDGALYNDTQDGDVYDDTDGAPKNDEVYVDTSGETYEPFDEKPSRPPPPPSGIAAKRNLPLPPPISSTISKSPSFNKKSTNFPALPPTPSPNHSPSNFNEPRDLPQLPPRTPVNSRPAISTPALPPRPTEEQEPARSPAGESKDDEDDYENMYQGVWDCNAGDDTELSFKRGDVLHIISREYDNYGWWIAKKNNIVGIVPRDYLIEAYEM